MKWDSSNDEPGDLTRLSAKQILEYAEEKSATKKDERDKSIRTKVANFIGSEGAGAILLCWCVFALIVDPLFLYIPFINEETKCFKLDPTLKITALVLRSFMDLPFALANILLLGSVILLWPLWFTKDAVFKRYAIVKFHLWDKDEEKDDMFHDLLFLSLFAVFMTLATFSLPQIAVLVLFPQILTRGSALIGVKVTTALILVQYTVRAWPTYYYCKRFNKGTLKHSKNKRWLPCLVNFVLYILASHVCGALWYFFSILRETSCWQSACLEDSECDYRTFSCDSKAKTIFKNVTRVNELCPINPMDATVLKYGIFAGPIQSGLVTSDDFLKKLLQGFSWGLRNLSSFASNINTSDNTWEILFVILVSISGLVLFMYLLGHMQTFMQSFASTRRIQQKIRAISPEIEFMVHEYGLPDNFKKAITKLVRRRLKQDEDLSVENIFSVLPMRLQDLLKRHLFLDTLRNMPRLREEVLKAILNHLEPVSYAAGNYIIREGEPLDMIFFLAQGTALTFQANVHCGGSTRHLAKRDFDGEEQANVHCGGSTGHVAKRDFYGKELITWAETQGSSLSNLPISTKTVKCHKKVEVFAIKAADLKQIVSKIPKRFNTEHPRATPTDSTFVEITDVVHSRP